MRKICFCLVMLLSTAGPGYTSPVVDSINVGATPSASTNWIATEVGWTYVPSFDYNLDGVLTKFGIGANDGRTITVEVYDEAPSAGGVLLRSGTFNPASDSFAGATFLPLALVAGEDYFIGFRNVGGLPVNVTSDGGATNLPGGLMYSFSNNGTYNLGPETGFTAQPILQFTGASNVPEPATMAVFGLMAVGAFGVRRRLKSAA